jgi:hypothetical protein
VPAKGVGDHPAQGRADEERDPEHGAEQALVLAAFGRREEVADHREGDREERAGADALEAAEGDELPHRLAETGQRGADQEDPDPDHEDRLAAEEVGQLAPEGHADRAREQVDGDDPDVQVVAIEVGHDPRQRDRHNCLVEGAQEQAEHDRDEDLHLRPERQAERRIFLDCLNVDLVDEFVGDQLLGHGARTSWSSGSRGMGGEALVDLPRRAREGR